MVKHKNLYEYRWTRINKKFTSNDGLLSFPISKLSRQFRTNVWQKKKKKFLRKFMSFTQYGTMRVLLHPMHHTYTRARPSVFGNLYTLSTQLPWSCVCVRVCMFFVNHLCFTVDRYTPLVEHMGDGLDGKFVFVFFVSVQYQRLR